jgi:mono/diheme cytochrome c family protein
MSCHGSNLEGRPGPNLQKIGSTKTKDQILTQITKGTNRMPGFEKTIQAADIEVLAAWLADKK